MRSVPTHFWLVGGEPRPVHVRSVSPSRIYVDVDGGDLELDREAFLNRGVLRGHDGADLDGVLALTAEDAAQRADEAAGDRLARVDESIDRLTAQIEELKRERKERKRERKRLRALTDGSG